MIGFTLEQAQADLASVNIAIEKLISGRTLLEIKISSAEMSRWSSFGQVSLEGLKAYRRELLDYINSISPTAPVFRSTGCMQVRVEK
jgi:hypothetical protein